MGGKELLKIRSEKKLTKAEDHTAEQTSSDYQDYCLGVAEQKLEHLTIQSLRGFVLLLGKWSHVTRSESMKGASA